MVCTQLSHLNEKLLNVEKKEKVCALLQASFFFICKVRIKLMAHRVVERMNGGMHRP